jgi:hypothetical protein
MIIANATLTISSRKGGVDTILKVKVPPLMHKLPGRGDDP